MRFAVLLLMLFAAPVFAADKAPLPKDLAPLPEPPPPPPGQELSPDLEPEVTIREKGQDRIEEFRIGGKLYMIKVTPKHGRAYYLVDDRGDGRFARQESLDTGTRVPQWVIHKF